MNFHLYFFLFFSFLLFFSKVSSLSFFLDSGSTKCLSEDVPKKELIVGEYMIIHSDEKGINIVVYDPKNTAVFQKYDSKEGKFAFTANYAGEYRCCFQNILREQVTVDFNLATGVNAKDYSEVAKKDHLKPMEIELKKLEDFVKETFNVMSFLKNREEEMRDTNESTNRRVLNFSLLSMFILVALGIWQVRHLRSYFKSKKIISS